MRGRRHHAKPLPTWLGRLLAVSVACASVTAGLALGTTFGAEITGWLAPASLSRIHLHGAFRLDPAQVSELTGAALGTPISRRDVASISERVKSHPWVSSARAAVLPGGVLIVGIEEHVPEAVVVTRVDPGTTRSLLVNRNGMPFAPASASEVEVLPHLLPTGEVAIGAPDARLAAALELAKRLPEHGLPGSVRIFISAQDDPEGLALLLPTLPARIVLGWVDPGAKLEQLAALLSSNLAEVRDALRIDLRFAGQAVLRTTRSKGGEQAAAIRGFALPSIALSTG